MGNGLSCYGKAFIEAGISRAVIGLRHPLQHFRNKAIKDLTNANIEVDILGENLTQGTSIKEACKACQTVNAPLLYRAAFKAPFSTLKYAMTLDGKIATSSGHAAWISSSLSRQQVFSTRARSDAVIVGGNTVRRDNPRLTTRKDGGHLPVRIVMSCGLNLPDEANLWDVSDTPTILMTQKGAREDFQERLQRKGVEIVEFDFLSPKTVADYCYKRGFLSILWECGGTLAAPAISSGVIHKVMAFVAPKIIGGARAPSPVGDMGMIEMTQALNLEDILFEQVGPDMLISGYLQPIPDLSYRSSEWIETVNIISEKSSSDLRSVLSFNQAWDAYGAFSNFSPHSINVASSNGKLVRWKTVEHYYQAQKFEGVQHTLAVELVEKIQASECPEEAERLGRSLQRKRPDLVRPDWDMAKMEVIYRALYSKFTGHPHLKSLLLSTAGSVLVDDSSRESRGFLGDLLMKLRTQLLLQESAGNANEFSLGDTCVL
ncbi:hypothetical protein GOP47_0012692 [Adiantum capillus-veneris]|uniref:5-amino-6-(5-phosphoribosylamino)uracil reductase n=1 Tax=Adiantum capillus-veneris TaxID=13818 RepID=A0A9D4URS7_ADICA|nr:hypothetical protein GOP47_0012692 [Adiantum capillus-veneris]